MTTHTLKTDPRVFDDVVAGRKKFEIRLDDRGFQEGDELILRKTRHDGRDMARGLPLEYIGPPIHLYVTHILRGPIYGLAPDWVIMSIEPCDGTRNDRPASVPVEALRKVYETWMLHEHLDTEDDLWDEIATLIRKAE